MVPPVMDEPAAQIIDLKPHQSFLNIHVRVLLQEAFADQLPTVEHLTLRIWTWPSHQANGDSKLTFPPYLWWVQRGRQDLNHDAQELA